MLEALTALGGDVAALRAEGDHARAASTQAFEENTRLRAQLGATTEAVHALERAAADRSRDITALADSFGELLGARQAAAPLLAVANALPVASEEMERFEDILSAIRRRADGMQAPPAASGEAGAEEP